MVGLANGQEIAIPFEDSIPWGQGWERVFPEVPKNGPLGLKPETPGRSQPNGKRGAKTLGDKPGWLPFFPKGLVPHQKRPKFGSLGTRNPGGFHLYFRAGHFRELPKSLKLKGFFGVLGDFNRGEERVVLV